MAKKEKHQLGILEEIRIWRKFDRIIDREGIRTRTEAIRRMIRSVVREGKLP